MIQEHDAAAHAAAISTLGHKRPHPCIGAQDAGLRQTRNQLHAFAQEQFHLGCSDTHIVAALKRNFVGSGAQHAHGVVGDYDIGIGRLSATVYDHICHPVTEHQQGAAAGQHGYLDARLCGKLRCPDTGGQDYEPAVIRLRIRTAADLHSGDPAVFHQETFNLAELDDIGSVADCVKCVCIGETERIHAGVGHAYGSYYGRIHHGYFALHLFRVQDLGRDAGLVAFLHKIRLPLKAVFRKAYEQAASGLHAVGSDSFKD